MSSLAPSLARIYGGMRENLLKLLFGEGVVSDSNPALGEQVVRLFENCADAETAELSANKAPLTAALKSIGVDAKVEAGTQWAEIRFDDMAAYRKAHAMIFNPDAMHALAVKGWVPASCGDRGMTFEPTDAKIGFIEIDTAETDDTNKAPDLEKVCKDGQACDVAEVEHDDELNPVDYDEKGSSKRDKGVGKAGDGEAPKGTPKGAKKTTESVRSSVSPHQLADNLLEMTGVSAIPAAEGPVLGIAERPDHKERFKRMMRRKKGLNGKP